MLKQVQGDGSFVTLPALIALGLPAGVVRGWTLLMTAATTALFFWRAYC